MVLIAAIFGWSHRWLRRGVTIWFAVFYAIASMPSAANTPYFSYFFKNINSSIFGWFGYAATTAGMVFEEKSYWLYIALYFILTALFIVFLIRSEQFYAKKLADAPVDRSPRSIIVSSLLTIALLTLCLFGIRGRRGYNPIKVSEAYYCEDSFLNQLGINPAFNLLTSVLDDLRPENKELRLMPAAEAVVQEHDLRDPGRPRQNGGTERCRATRELQPHSPHHLRKRCQADEIHGTGHAGRCHAYLARTDEGQLHLRGLWRRPAQTQARHGILFV